MQKQLFIIINLLLSLPSYALPKFIAKALFLKSEKKYTLLKTDNRSKKELEIAEATDRIIAALQAPEEKSACSSTSSF